MRSGGVEGPTRVVFGGKVHRLGLLLEMRVVAAVVHLPPYTIVQDVDRGGVKLPFVSKGNMLTTFSITFNRVY